MSGCTGCGSSCRGWALDPNPEEHAQLRKAAQRLRLGDPFEGVSLKQVDGSCIFLRENRCLVHDIKPEPCRQWPILQTVVEGGDVRVGIDPCCTNAVHREWPTHRASLAQNLPYPLPVHNVEIAVLSALRKAETLDKALREIAPRAFDATSAWWTMQPAWDGPPLLRAALETTKTPGVEVWTEKTSSYAKRAVIFGVESRRWANLKEPGNMAVALAIGAKLAARSVPSDTAWGLRFAAWARYTRTTEFASRWLPVLKAART